MNKDKIEELSKKFTELTQIECDTKFIPKGINHQPTTLEKGKKGVYVFLLSNKVCFKVGKAGSNSMARWNSHHYNLDKATKSTFTKSFLSDLNNFKKYFDDKQKKEIEYFEEILLKYSISIKNLKTDME